MTGRSAAGWHGHGSRRGDFLLDESQKLLGLRQGYAQSSDVARIISTHDLQHIDTQLEPSIPISTRRKTNFILIPRLLKRTASRSLLGATLPFP
jgi:hypothetical protein